MATRAPEWTPEEQALHVAYELSPTLRRRFPTYELAMSNEAVAAALRAFSHAWRKTTQQQQGETPS